MQIRKQQSKRTRGVWSRAWRLCAKMLSRKKPTSAYFHRPMSDWADPPLGPPILNLKFGTPTVKPK